MEKATEDTYVAEFVSTIKEIGGPIGYDAEFNKTTPSGRADVNLFHKGTLVAVIEVKEPHVPLSDPALKVQAERYAEWYRKKRSVCFYGIHNLKYLSVFKYATKEKGKNTGLLEYMGVKSSDWVSISDFPFRIMPWVRDISEFKQISTNNQARKNLSDFLLKFKEILEGKSLDLSAEVIEVVKRYIEEGASHGLTRYEDLYRTGEKNVRNLFEDWRRERAIQKPKNDEELRAYLTLMIKEQLYTLSMKVLFYFVLQNIDAEMSSKLKENLADIEPSDADLFQKIFDMLFKYAMERTGDFEEVFGTNTVDRLPLVDQTLKPLKELIGYLHQIRWTDINVDIIGRVFEGLIYNERRHLLGQHYTETAVVDLILAATLREPGRTLDPSCGSGTFLVRTLNYWKANYQSNPKNLELVEGTDIDKLASMLSKINLYIQALEFIKNKSQYNPKIYHKDFFKSDATLSDLRYVVTNPPYTRQEEMTLAFYDKDYKKNFDLAVSGIPDWNSRASIYAYFLVGGAKRLKEKGRLGFIVENSWLNTEYGGPLKDWFLKNYSVDFVIESICERWFQDAAIITNIMVCERNPNPNDVTKFIYLKKTLVELFGAPPPSNDLVANQNYYEKMRAMLNGEKAVPKGDYVIQENDGYRTVAVRKNLLETIEKTIGKWGIIKGPKEYFEIIIKFLKGQDVGLKSLGSVVDVDRGITTNANEIFYLPSKYWAYLDETENYLTVRGSNYKALKLNKDYLRPLIRLPHIKKSPYVVSKLTKKKHEDYVLWVEDASKVQDPGVSEYLKWASEFVKQERVDNNARFPTLAGKLDLPTWPQLPNKSNGRFFFKNDMNNNYSIHLNRVSGAQVDKRLFLGNPLVDVDERIIFATLNSVFTYLGMELMGRTNLGEGALDCNVVDYKKIPVIDPERLKKKLEEDKRLDEFLRTVDKVMEKRPVDISTEAQNADRMKMEQMVLGSIGFGKKDINRFYDDLIALSNLRASRAASLKKGKAD